MLQTNLSVNAKGHLTFAGQDTVELAKRYGTPAYILDENRVRENCRLYTKALGEHMGEGSLPLYASKALCFKGLYSILAEEGMGADVVSGGEICTALAAGFPAERMFFHGNNKTVEEIGYAMDNGVGYFIIDGLTEMRRVDEAARDRNIRQKALLRLTPGIDPHTFDAVNTGKIDCQFGVPIETGQARAFVTEALSLPNLDIRGYHCHVGSQVFDVNPFVSAAEILTTFAAEISGLLGYEPEILNLGGGFGVRYVESDPHVDIPGCIALLCEEVKRLCGEKGLPVPAIMLEPGRSIVADACITLYTAGPCKNIDGYRNYVVVDGGMSDNPRYALYGAQYTVALANRANEDANFVTTIAGRCCETGALLQENVRLPEPRVGDIVAVFVTGAYNYSMASNYNRICRPPIVILRDGESRIGVRRETFADLTACDI